MPATRPVQRLIPADLPIADESRVPFDEIRERDPDNEAPKQRPWRRYLVRLLGWWPDD